MMNRLAALLVLLFSTPCFAANYTAGVAAIDVTPNTPIRLSGYGNRTEETADVKQHLFVKALALRADAGPVALLITLDNCAINLTLSDEVCARITVKTGVPRERIAINLSHTHCAPMLTNCIPNIFSKPIPPEHQAHIDAYTQQALDAMVQAAAEATAAMQPAKLYFGIGSANFGTNRRTPGGPTDHDLPVLCVNSPDGTVRALVAGYACHCTSLSENVINGDWAGFAQAAMQAAYPDAIGMVAVGCGGDQNPMPRGTLEHAQRYGQEIADNVKKVVDTGLREIDAPLDCALKQVPLAFDPIPTREEFEQRAKEESPRGYHARVQLAKLDRGEQLHTEIPYTIQTWAFGDQLAMLFLAGEVVVDYSTRFKIEYDRNRLWVCGYSNQVPCYIPSFRIREEGGYEGADAMVYYDQPTRFAADVEDRIAAGVHELLPAAYKNDHAKTNGFPPLRPYDALREFVVPEGYEVQLVACEPNVASPVAVDFAPDGAIFVCEMYDYNIPPAENTPPAGRIRRLTDSNGDGFYDKSTIYLDHVPYPTGVTVWRDGILVCAAPDIILAEDTDHDGVADTRKVLLTGFSPINFQARVNSLSWGLDNWMYGGGGMLGGLIKNPESDVAPIGLGARDFRFNPDTGVFETATGSSQYGRARDDWDNWFGGDSSVLLKYYALPEDLLKKAPAVVPPPTIVTLAGPPYDVYPASTTIERLNDPEDFNRITSACGLAIYRDDLLGPAFTGNAFAAEPVHNLVTRLVVEPKGASFTAHRAAGEEHSEFLASKDHWFRPSQMRTGPDGALWVVDMYRYVIEHEKWITPDRRESLDMFAGKELGRIYRIKPKGAKLRPVQDLTKLASPDLVAALNTSNGTVRDLIHQMLLWRNDSAAVEPLKAMAMDSAKTPIERTHALCILDGLDELDSLTLAECSCRLPVYRKEPPVLTSPAPSAKIVLNSRETNELRRHVVRLIGSHTTNTQTFSGCTEFEKEYSAPVAEACAFAVANSHDKNNALLLAIMLINWSSDTSFYLSRTDMTTKPEMVYEGPSKNAELKPHDEYVVAAALIASAGMVENVVEWLVYDPGYLPFKTSPMAHVFGSLSEMAATQHADQTVNLLFQSAMGCEYPERVQVVLDAALSHGYTIEQLVDPDSKSKLDDFIAKARGTAQSADSDNDKKITALKLLARLEEPSDKALATFHTALAPDTNPAVQLAAVKALATRDDDAIGDFLVRELPDLGPETRNAALDALIRRAAWCAKLLDYFDAHPEARTGLSAERKQFLIRHPDIDLRERAVKLLGDTASDQRAAVIAKYADVLTLKGDPAAGTKSFQERCAQCHQLGNVGHPLGPDLSALTDKSPAALIKAILDPNETVSEQYQAFNVETNDLRTLTGVIAEESANSIHLKMAEGAEETLLRTDIATLTNTARSLMPEGLEENLSPAQIADIIAFIQSNAPTPKKFKGNSPARIAPNAEGAYYLTAENAALYGGPDFEYRPRFGAIGGWTTPADHADWTLDVATPGDFEIEMTWTSPLTSADTPYQITCGANTLNNTLPTTGGMENFTLKTIGTLHLEPGPQTLTLHPTAPPRDGMMELRALTLKPR